MKKSIKYISLTLSSIICFVSAVVLFGLLADAEELINPATLIMPTLAIIALIITCIIFVVWSFKFSDGKEHRSSLVIFLTLLTITIVLFCVAKFINGALQ